MQSEVQDFDGLIERLKQMPPADRKAVLARLAFDQRYLIEDSLAGRGVTAATEQGPTPSQKHRIFSPTLARMLDAIERGDVVLGGNGKPLTPATSAALAECANAYWEEISKSGGWQSGSLRDVVRRIFFAERAK